MGQITDTAEGNAQEMSRFFSAIANLIEEAYLKNDDNKKKIKCMEALQKHIGAEGKLSYQHIAREHASVMMQELEEMGMPHMCLPDEHGNFVFMVREQDAQRFLDIQKTHLLSSTDYAKELNPERVLSMYGRHGMKNADVLTIKDPQMAQLAENKLYQSGITFAKAEEKDGSTKFVVSPMSKYSPKGDDLCHFELIHAYEQSKASDLITQKGDLLGLRFEQDKWDSKQMDDFVSALSSGKPAIFAPQFGEVNKYIQSDGERVYLMERNANAEGGWKESRLSIDLENSTKEQIKIALSKPAAGIKDASTVDDKIKIKNFKTYRNEPIPNRKEAIGAGFPEKELRPIGNSRVQGLEDATNALKPMLEAINKEASRRVDLMFDTEVMSQQKAYSVKKEVMIEIMEKAELPEIQEFLQSNPVVDAKEWYDTIKEHFKNPDERGNKYALVVDREKVSDLQKQFSKLLDGKENEKGRENDSADREPDVPSRDPD